jgi:hypothetical protein
MTGHRPAVRVAFEKSPDKQLGIDLDEFVL